MTVDNQLFDDLEAFVTEGRWALISPPPVDGETVATVLMRAADDGTIEVLTMKAPEETQARRENPDGLLVWSVSGHLRDVMQALRELPPPGTPDAPDKPIRDRGEVIGREL